MVLYWIYKDSIEAQTMGPWDLLWRVGVVLGTAGDLIITNIMVPYSEHSCSITYLR